jgi:2-polyprenyl-3-methyl-5-hydroxy-6-metoxy-1,4-benzoquinol methylase
LQASAHASGFNARVLSNVTYHTKKSNNGGGSAMYVDGGYELKNPSWHVEDSPWKAAGIVQALAFLPQAPRAICDVGCGAGEILRQLEIRLGSEAVELVGYDISPQAIALARAREGRRLKFVLGDANSDGRHFDVLIGIDVIEHIEDHLGFLNRIRHKADYFIFHIPLELNCESLLRDFVMANRRLYGHLHQFTRDTARATLEHCGYTVIHDFYTEGYEQMPDNFHTRVTKAARRIIFGMLPALSRKLMNGNSLMVICRS